MQNSGDGADYRAMSTKCPNCLDYADYIEGIWKAGGYVKTDGWSIKSSHTSKPTSQGQLEVTIAVDAAPTEYKETARGDVKHHAGGKADFIITVADEHGESSRS